MRRLTTLALAAAVALAAPLGASADTTNGVQIDSSVTKQAVSDHLNRTAQVLDAADSGDATGARMIVAARRAYAIAVKYWKGNDYVPAEDYTKATDALLAGASVTGRGDSDTAFDATGRVVASLSPASAFWLTSFANELYQRALSDRMSDPQSAALDLARAQNIARASQFATQAVSGAPAGSNTLPALPAVSN